MVLLNFPDPPLTINQIYNAPNGVTYSYDGSVWLSGSGVGGASVSVGPTAPPNPHTGDLWWRNDPDGNLYLWYNDGNSSQWVPTMASVGTISGPAGGDLLGTYPNPTLRPAALPWSISGTTLTPTDATKIVAVPGLASTGEALRVSPRTIKGRLLTTPTSDWLAVTCNHYYDGAVWRSDDAAKASWGMFEDAAADVFIVQHAVAGSPATRVNLLTLDNVGNLTLSGPTVTTHGYSAAGTFAGAASSGTAAAPTAMLQWGQLVRLDGWGTYQAPNSNSVQAYVLLYAEENWTATARGTGCQINVTPNGTTGIVQALTVSNNQNLTIGGQHAYKAGSTTAWEISSDIRIKKNLRPYARGLTAIRALMPKEFEFNGEGDTQNGLPGIGLVADDVKGVMPEMVGLSAKTGYHTLDVTALQFALVNAVKELDVRLQAVEKR